MAGKIYYDAAAMNSIAPVVSGEVATFEKEYALDYNQRSIWKAPNEPATYLFNFGAPVNIKAAYVGNTNLQSTSTTFELQAGTTSATTDFSISLKTNAVEMGGSLGRKSWAEFDETYQYWKFVFNIGLASTPFAGKLELFRKVYSFAKDYQSDHTLGSEAAFIETGGNYLQSDSQFKDLRGIGNFTFLHIEPAQFQMFDKTIRQQEYTCFYDIARQEIFFTKIQFSPGSYTRGGKYNMTASVAERR